MSKPRRLPPRDTRGRFIARPKPKPKVNVKPVKARPSKAQRIQNRMDIRGLQMKEMQQKNAYRDLKQQSNLKRGGLVGWYSRKKALKQAKLDAKLKQISAKPEIERNAAETSIQTKAKVLQTKAKYAGYAGVASALSSGYATGKVMDKAKSDNEREATEKIAEALEDYSNNVPSFNAKEQAADSGSVAGLRTGVR